MPNKKYKYHEYHIRDLFRQAGFKCERVPCSGNARGFKGDIVVYLPNGKKLIGDVAFRGKKYRSPLCFFKPIERNTAYMIMPYEYLLMSLETFLHFLKNGTGVVPIADIELDRLNRKLKEKVEKYNFAIMKTHSVQNVVIRKEKFAELQKELIKCK